MDNLGGIDIFVHAAKAGSFVGAAQKLGLTPSAVSKAVSRLEQRLNTQLFNRTTRALALTEDGHALFARSEAAVEQLETAQEFLLHGTAEPRGRLRLSMPVVFGATHVAPYLTEFCERHPKVQIETHSTDGLSSLVDEGFDLLIRTGQLADSNMIARPLLQTRFLTCASPVYLEKFGEPKTLQELADHDCSRYVFPTSGRFFPWPFEHQGERLQLEVSGTQSFSNASAMIQSAVAGGGLVHLQDYMLQPYIDRGELVPVLRGFECDGGPVSAVYMRHRHIASKVRVFVDFLREKLAAE